MIEVEDVAVLGDAETGGLADLLTQFERAMATVVETFHDENGIIWPTSVAPFEVVITIVSLKDEASVAGAETLYRELSGRGVDVLLDDRDARAGVKFADAELIGIPHRVTFGPKAFAEGEVEYTPRASGETERIATGVIADQLVDTITAARPSVKNQVTRGARAPRANAQKEATAAVAGLPTPPGSIPSSSRAWTSRATSGSEWMSSAISSACSGRTPR